jgi:hypothetical protein
MFWFGNDKEKVQTPMKDNVFNTESMLPVSEIRWDTLVLKDGGLRAILKIWWLNIDLKNYDEQVVIVEQYKRFLNGLSFPIQILVRNSYLELSDYISYMKENISGIKHDKLKEQWQWYVDFLDDINTKQWLIYVKEFYIVIPYYQSEQDTENTRKPRWQKFMNALSNVETPEKIVTRYRNFMKYDKYLDTRVVVIQEWLKGLWISAERLRMTDIIWLLFKAYNPDTHKDQAQWVE